MSLHGREIADAPRRVHLAHEAIAHLRHEASAVFIFPFLERAGCRNLESIEEWTTDMRIAVAEMVHVRVNPSGRQTDRGALDHHRFARNLGFDDRETLSKRMIRMLRRRIRP